MRRAWILAVLLPTSALAASGITGYLQEQFTQRAHDTASCAAVEACSTMVNERRIQVLGEWQPSAQFGTVLRIDGVHDNAIQDSRALLREGYADWALSPRLAVRAGRQVITWGVADYLFVNDLFPKNYDAFLTGKPFDHMKGAVDAVKINGMLGEVEADLVLARPQQDDMPSPARFLSAAFPAGVTVEQADRASTDVALRLALKLGRWDSAFYVGHYRSREAGLYGMSSTALRWEMQPTTHVGASATGAIADGVGLAEIAYLDTKNRPGNMNPYLPGRHVKGLVGYTRELGDELSFSVQYHHDYEIDYSDYVQSLAPTVTPAPRSRQTAYLRLHKRLLHQTLGLGVQGFVSGDGGSSLNPFASYSIVDGMTVEAGINWFSGPADSRYGAMRQDSNLYTSLRYSF